MPELSEFLAACPLRAGVRLISEPRSFAHPEEKYDQQYGIERLDLDFYRDEGEALVELCRDYDCPAGPALEIGCGAGRFSLSLALAGISSHLVLTDPSPSFCEITAAKLARLPQPAPAIEIAVLDAGDLSRFPRNAFSLIVLRSTLHHIADVARFLSECAGALVPEGLVLFEEPCYEGYLVMGVIARLMPSVLKGRGVKLTEKHVAAMRCFADTMLFYVRRDVDKSAAEDKHIFRADELMRASSAAGLRLEHFPNRVFGNIRERNSALPRDYFRKFFFDYVRYAMNWDPELVDLTERHIAEYLDYFAPLVSGGAMPHTYGVFLCKKTA
jgi:ubiquinone/menaquinone biosynthesis C-methylase UbiE